VTWTFSENIPQLKTDIAVLEEFSRHLFLEVSYSGRGKFMPLPLKSKILETPGFLVTDYMKMFPL
jgi:hypothetical protein